jgi:uncharacterized protein YjbI with pentapeptide repeats
LAHKEYVDLLKKGADVWNEWRRGAESLSQIHPDLYRADLRGVDLSYVELYGSGLRGAILTESILVGANFEGANLIQADLSRANLEGAKFKDAKLKGAILSESKLTEVDLSAADLIAADLTEANVAGVNLSHATLRRANLTGADLTGTNLSYTNLIGAILSGAKFLRTQLRDTVFISNDLSMVVDLDMAFHEGPSYVGLDTLTASKGKIPETFLRGCGLSDLHIEVAKLAALGLDSEQVTDITDKIHRLYLGGGIQYYSCFISYSSRDQEFAQRLHDDLQNNGVRCWFAPEDLKIGDEFRRSIGTQIRLRDKLLIILSENSISSEWVGDEVEKALAEEKDQGMLKLFPIRLDDAVLKTKDDWAEKIRLRRHIGDFSKEYVPAFERLLRDLKPQ